MNRYTITIELSADSLNDAEDIAAAIVEDLDRDHDGTAGEPPCWSIITLVGEAS